MMVNRCISWMSILDTKNKNTPKNAKKQQKNTKYQNGN